MKLNLVGILLAVGLVGCVEPAESPQFGDELKSQAVEVATLCAIEKADQFSEQAGSPTELGMLAALSCREDIAFAALVYAEGRERIARDLYPRFLTATAEMAALRIANTR